jgi:tetratricopeptide (TPR) repeat protein
MGTNENIIVKLKEADLYQKQGLLTEAKSKYQEVVDFLSSHSNFENAGKIKISVLKKIKEIEKEILYVEKKVLSPYMTKESQDLITRMFISTDGEDPNIAILEGAKALIKFGQFERAIEELSRLLEIESMKTEAAKQILNSHLLASKASRAIDQYERWVSAKSFDKDQFEKMKIQIQDFLKNSGMDKDFPKFFDVHEPMTVNGITFQSDSHLNGAKKEESLDPKRDTFFFEEEYEEYDVLASIGKRKKPDGKKG